MGGTATKSDIKPNKYWLSGIIPLSPEEVPSGYMLADVFLAADRKFLGKLLHHGTNGCKQARAMEEGSKLRMLWSRLRTLFRQADRRIVAVGSSVS